MTTPSIFPAGLSPLTTAGAQVFEHAPGVWRLQTPPSRSYCVAQLDDYQGRPRRALPWQPPFTLRLRLRASAADLPGTWGVGLWNDPFAMGMNLSERLLRLPALPNTAWFFHASPPNYLSLRDDRPAQGWLAGVFRSPHWPSALLALGAPGLALLALPPAARGLRRLARRIVRQDSHLLDLDVTAWHTYALQWEAARVRFWVDEALVCETPLAPLGPLGVVIWIDNQYMSFTPAGRLKFGVLPTSQPGWIEIADLSYP